MNMNDPRDEAKVQVDAGLSLLVKSHLVKWDAGLKNVKTIDEDTFESASQEWHSKYGRLMSWMLFSAGAEFLAKGACLAQQIDMRKMHRVPDDPIEPLATWRTNLLN